MQRRRWLSLACIALAALTLGTAGVLASDSTTLLGYQTDFLGWVDNGNGTSTWTYAVTVDGDEGYGLSYWTIQIPACFGAIDTPAPDSLYTTPTSPSFGCGTAYSCEAAQCMIEYGTDPGTGINGIKFGDCSPQLDIDNGSLPRTQIYQFTIQGVPAELTEVEVGDKANVEWGKSTIAGPSCASGPTGVGLLSFSATSGTAGWLQPGLLLFAVGIVLAGVGLRSRRR